MGRVRIAVIEWASDDAEAPAVYVGTEEYVVQAAAVAMHNRMADDPDYEDVLAEVGDPADPAWGLREALTWHRIVREAHTSPWVTFYAATDALYGGGEAEPDNDLNRQLLYPLEVQS